MLTLEGIFPPFGLRISCGPLELRTMRDDDLPAIVQLVRDGIEQPGLPMPFLMPWHRVPFELGNADAFPASSLAYWWLSRAGFADDSWRLLMVARYDGEVVGQQDISSEGDFRETAACETGSWLGRAYHGRGIGTLMRQCVVGFGFQYLGAQVMRSGFVDGNLASEAVARKTGYRETGHRVIEVEGKPTIERLVEATPDGYIAPPYPIEADGVGPFRRYIGLDVEPTPG